MQGKYISNHCSQISQDDSSSSSSDNETVPGEIHRDQNSEVGPSAEASAPAPAAPEVAAAPTPEVAALAVKTPEPKVETPAPEGAETSMHGSDFARFSDFTTPTIYDHKMRGHPAGPAKLEWAPEFLAYRKHFLEQEVQKRKDKLAQSLGFCFGSAVLIVPPNLHFVRPHKVWYCFSAMGSLRYKTIPCQAPTNESSEKDQQSGT